MKEIKRYGYFVVFKGSSIEPVEQKDGGWVRYDDVKGLACGDIIRYNSVLNECVGDFVFEGQKRHVSFRSSQIGEFVMCSDIKDWRGENIFKDEGTVYISNERLTWKTVFEDRLGLINKILDALIQYKVFSNCKDTFVFHDCQLPFYEGLKKLQIIGNGSPWKLYTDSYIIMPDPENEKELLVVNRNP